MQLNPVNLQFCFNAEKYRLNKQLKYSIFPKALI